MSLFKKNGISKKRKNLSVIKFVCQRVGLGYGFVLNYENK